jgi:hypothetical protein
VKRPSLQGWKDPRKRPRYILWTGALIMGLAAFVIAAVGVTSSYWFCANVCHMVMDDSIIAYNHSPHANISCIACHTGVNGDPYHFLLHKAEFGIDGGYKVLTNTFHLPPNPESEVALETPAEQCVQCHAGYKKINPSPGMKIDHDAHKEAGVTCTSCHNRVAHQETSELTLAGNTKHADFMEMEGCFRCHSQEAEAEAPGRCSACHTEDFQLVPDTHATPAFYTPFGDSSGHAKLARDDQKRLAEVAAETEGASEEEAAKAHGAEEGHELPSIHEVSYCGQCHAESFCDACHGLDIPHPADFTKDHSADATKSPATCGKCHADSELASGEKEFCSDCHHKIGDTGKPWFPQHPAFANKDAYACLKCHTTMYCETCHVSGKPKVAF